MIKIDKSNEKSKLNPNSKDFVSDLRYAEQFQIRNKFCGYDGTPIVLVTTKNKHEIFNSFSYGNYGFDTESDCKNNTLKLIQIYDGKTVYILSVDIIILSKSCPIIKFLSSKTKIKIGVDIDGDQRALAKYFSYRRRMLAKSNISIKFRIAFNGFVDLQSIAQLNGESIKSLNGLSDKYVEDFIGNPSKLGSYVNPTREQYIYAANDAILSLKICKPLLNKRPCARWLNLHIDDDSDELEDLESKNDFFAWVFPILAECQNPRSFKSLVFQACNSYKPWQTKYSDSVKEIKAERLLKSFIDEGLLYFDEFNKVVCLNEISSEEIDSYEEQQDPITEIDEYNFILYHMKKITQHEPPKKKQSYINQLSNSYGPWVKIYPIFTRKELSREFIDLAISKQDLIKHGNVYTFN